ncbi:hypothetical protein GJ496_008772 [Pomphorhynchus laevis]|nr:hypothetical protein GJ496_006520 [Pomphorhynchus laevis]KAI0979605.1 hypothetical protein GJ496_008772 [Pomphorhynchus laevis]
MDSNKQLIDALTRHLLSKDIRSVKELQAFINCKTYDNTDESRQIAELSFRKANLSAALDDINTLLQFAWDAASNNLVSTSLPVLLIGDTFSTHLLDDCEHFFGKLIEENTSNWKLPIFYNTTKNILLRVINDLLKRASKVQKTEFCGRIQLFLANFYPITEKSGLNLMSHFNIENVTIFDSTATSDASSGTSAMIPSSNGIFSKDLSGVLIDVALHRRFWSLQAFFADPNLCLNTEGWKSFSSCSSEVLNVFASFKLSTSSSNKISSLPKYLTSENLLDMQLSDPVIRRHILIQFLILFDYLRGPVKFRPENLSADKLVWIDNARQQVKHLLRDTPTDGIRFEREISRILSRDMNIWSRWKNDGCPSFIKEPIITSDNNKSEKTVINNFPENDSNFHQVPHLPAKTANNETVEFGKSSSAILYQRVQKLCSENEIRLVRKSKPLLDWQVLRLFRWRRPPKPASRNIPKVEDYMSSVYERISSDCRQPPLKRSAVDYSEDESVVNPPNKA